MGGQFTDYLRSLWVCDTMPLWFIRELMALSLITPLIYRIKKIPILMILVSLIAISLATMGIVGYRSFVYWLPVYMMGASLNSTGLAKLYNYVTTKNGRILTVILVALYVAWAWFLPNGIEKGNALFSLVFIIFRIATPIVLLLLMLLMSEKGIRDRRFMHYSFFVYCMHFPAITILSVLYERVIHPASSSAFLLEYLILVGVSYSVCVIMAMTLEDYIPRLWAVLNGNRRIQKD